MLRIAVLASGRGSNLQALIDAIAAGRIDAQLVGVFSDRADAFALERARRAGIATLSLSPRDFADRLAFDKQLFSHIDAVHPDVIVCAGYMRLLSDREVEAHAGRMINIHLSLLPEFKGLRTHQQALAAGVSEHGASVHVVSAELDGGPVIAQARVSVLPGDDVPMLAQRVLDREHPLLVETLRWLAAGRLVLDRYGATLDGAKLSAPLQLDADN
ncbi:MAG TPA: phosphoribosylglycinamide formyltransferase, partial [Lysobacter sp.]